MPNQERHLPQPKKRQAGRELLTLREPAQEDLLRGLPSNAVDIAVSAIIGDIDAISLGNHHQLVCVRVSEVSEPVNLVGNITGHD